MATNFPTQSKLTSFMFTIRRFQNRSTAGTRWPCFGFVRLAAVSACTLLLAAAAVDTRAAAPAPDEADVEAAQMRFFETRIRPILAENCYSCHGDERQRAGLRVDSIDGLLRGGDSGAALQPGDPHASLMAHAISYEDPDFQMPPDGKLADAEIEALRQWIEMGAFWPGAGPVRPISDLDRFSEDDHKWWSLQPLSSPTPPEANGVPGKAHNEIDRFVLKRLGEAGLQQAPEAGREELVRRVYFDLHGLPPTPEEIREFVEDQDPDAYTKLIDRLLDSPRYGERWGQHWLDLTRYAESDGYRQDAYRPDAWRFRDYVIRSFNEDKPYDQLIREHLAGDEINPDDPDVFIGTAFLRHGIYEWNQRDAEGQWDAIVTEMTDVTGELFMGLSMGCAQCHDHKFDPILQQDYYRLKAFFTPISWPVDRVLATPGEREQHARELAVWEEATKEIRARIDEIAEESIQRQMRRAMEMFPENVQQMVRKDEPDRTPYEQQIYMMVRRQMDHERTRWNQGGLSDEEKKELSELNEKLAEFDDIKPRDLPSAFVATDVRPESSPTTYATRAGEVDVEPGFLTILESDPIEVEPVRLPDGSMSTGRRSALAEWLTRPDNQLTTRVIANRIWHYHFNQGLVPTTSDFGRLGQEPSHPELLDWLAREFVARGWSFKEMHRLIMHSATYRQTARVQVTDELAQLDPDNRLLWRMNPRRLDAEQIRDAVLHIAGQLDGRSEGPAVDVARNNARSVFARRVRNNPDELLRTLDAPPGFISVAERDSTTTPLQALIMMNGEWMINRAAAFARRLTSTHGERFTEDLVSDAFFTVYGRQPTGEEIGFALDFLSQHRDVVEGRADTPEGIDEPGPDDHPVVSVTESFPQTSGTGNRALRLRPDSDYERLVAESNQVEPDEFTIQAVVYLESLYPSADVRTLVSRWNGQQDGTAEAAGWALGVTSTRSNYQPNNLIMQIVGDDFQGNPAYEVVASDLFIQLNTPYYVAVVVSTEPAEGETLGGSVTFHTRDLSDPDAELNSVTVATGIAGGLVRDDRQLILGGRGQEGRSMWHGSIARLSLTPAKLQRDQLFIGGGKAPVEPIGDWLFDDSSRLEQPSQALSWLRPSRRDSGPGSPEFAVIADFCHLLLNSNEFLYLY